jgi:hypothetical protein
MAKADHIYVHRVGFTHHGIDLGDGTAVHYTGEVGRKAGAAIRRTGIGIFAGGSPVQVRRYGHCFRPRTVIRRALSRLGEARYSLPFNNCEHFAVWCETGRPESEQVKDAASLAGGATGVGAGVAGGLGAVSATGAVAGLSGSGVMSGLATVGGVVGGGAVAGLAVVGVAPAAAATLAMGVVLRDRDSLPAGERQARRAGRLATLAGGVAGSVAGVATVSAAGTVAGLCAAGITSGLAAIGAVARGGMVVGVSIVAAGPAVAAVGIGYGTYRVWRWARRKGVGSDAHVRAVEDQEEQWGGPAP